LACSMVFVAAGVEEGIVIDNVPSIACNA